MNIDCGSRSLCVRLILLLVIGLGLPMLSAKVTYAEDEKELVVAAADKADPGATPAIPEKQPTKAKDRPPLVKEPSHLKDKLKDKEMEKKDGAQDPKPNAK